MGIVYLFLKEINTAAVDYIAAVSSPDAIDFCCYPAIVRAVLNSLVKWNSISG